jgi:hypothetical protein
MNDQQAPAVVLSRDAVAEVLRKRMQNSNFTAIQHEPLRTQVIDQWVEVFADAVMALARPENEVKAEALEQFRDYLDERADEFGKRRESPYLSGMEYSATLAHRRAHALRDGS